MAEFILFRKDHHLTAVNKSDAESASLLVGQGYKGFEGQWNENVR
ncbi:TPA: hypothetical protein ACXK2U_004308 [Serratia marcescens]|nr:hypothetical protein [Serratia nevei]